MTDPTTAAPVPAQGNPAQGNPAQGNPVQGNPVQGNPAQGNPVQGNPAQGNPVQGNPVQGNPAPAPAAQEGPAESVSGPWAAYLAAAQHLDTLRRSATAAAYEQSTTMQAAAQELAATRARLAPQRARLVQDLGVPVGALSPTEPELRAATQAVAGGPGAALMALRQARGFADAADATVLGAGGRARGPLRPWARNLLVYGPFAAAVLIVQIVLYLIAPSGSVPKLALGCGLSMPVLAFGLGWVTIGFVWGGGDAKVDRTPLIGIIACLTPVLLTCMGVGIQQIF